MSLENNGFATIENALDDGTIAILIDDLSNLPIKLASRGIYGVRNLRNLSPKINEFSKSKIVKNIVETHLGGDAKLVRAIFFDKTPDANWKVPWHQDLTIAVRERIDTDGFKVWTVKDKVPHVQPPIAILEKMITLRFHLDDADETNGALKVIPKSHKYGRLNATEIEVLKSKEMVKFGNAKRGDCFLMRPLLVHSSSAGSEPQHRRVIQFEFSLAELPNGLEFYGS
jgi:ectoine hydroxylase-related dioxygenase (phytanoyl-CoA dioxygenase family)